MQLSPVNVATSEVPQEEYDVQSQGLQKKNSPLPVSYFLNFSAAKRKL